MSRFELVNSLTCIFSWLTWMNAKDVQSVNDGVCEPAHVQQTSTTTDLLNELLLSVCRCSQLWGQLSHVGIELFLIPPSFQCNWYHLLQNSFSKRSSALMKLFASVSSCVFLHALLIGEFWCISTLQPVMKRSNSFFKLINCPKLWTLALSNLSHNWKNPIKWKTCRSLRVEACFGAKQPERPWVCPGDAVPSRWAGEAARWPASMDPLARPWCSAGRRPSDRRRCSWQRSPSSVQREKVSSSITTLLIHLTGLWAPAKPRVIFKVCALKKRNFAGWY